MKFMIASDIHGSAYYCEKLITAYKNEKADRLLLLGDILYHGPRNELPRDYAPKRVAAMLNEYADSIFCVKGNCEAEVDSLMLDFSVEAEYCLIPTAGRLIFASHGHHFGENNPPKHSKGDIILTGHTHIPACVEHETYLYVNPGSVSIPKNGSVHGYMIFDGEGFVWKDLDGNIYNEYKL